MGSNPSDISYAHLILTGKEPALNTGSNPRGCIGSNPIVGAKFVLKRIKRNKYLVTKKFSTIWKHWETPYFQCFTNNVDVKNIRRYRKNKHYYIVCFMFCNARRYDNLASYQRWEIKIDDISLEIIFGSCKNKTNNAVVAQRYSVWFEIRHSERIYRFKSCPQRLWWVGSTGTAVAWKAAILKGYPGSIPGLTVWLIKFDESDYCRIGQR